MGTPADKLSYLLDTKAAIREAIEGKGQTITNTDTFRSYADKIGSISTSDASGPEISVSDAGYITATSSGGSTTITLSQEHDAQFEAANIKSDVIIFGVKGTYSQTPVTETISTISLTIKDSNYYYANIWVSSSMSKLCAFTAIMYNDSRNCVISYNPHEDSATYARPDSASKVYIDNTCSVSVNGNHLRIQLPVDYTTNQLYNTINGMHVSISYIPA